MCIRDVFTLLVERGTTTWDIGEGKLLVVGIVGIMLEQLEGEQS